MFGKDEVTSSNLVISSTRTCRNVGSFLLYMAFSASFDDSACKIKTSSVFPSEIRQFLSNPTTVCGVKSPSVFTDSVAFFDRFGRINGAASTFVVMF